MSCLESGTFAWLIELPRISGVSSYWDGRGVDTFVLDPNDAVRFDRQEDAERVASWLVRADHHHQPRHGLDAVVAREHGWADR